MLTKTLLKRVLLLLLCFFSILPAQYYEKSPQSGVGSPYFEIVVQNQFNEASYGHRLLVLARLLYDDIHFVKSDTSGFDGEIELLLAVYDMKKRVVASTTIKKIVNVKDFKTTNSRELQLLMKTTLDVPPGEYILLARSTDLNTNKSIQRKIQLNLPEYKNVELKLGGIIFLQDILVDTTNHIKEIDPIFGNNFTLREGYFYAKYDLYCKDIPAEVSLLYEIEDEDEEVEWDTTVVKNIDKHITSQILKVNKSVLKRNRYKLYVVAKTGKFSTEISRSFSFFWSDIPFTNEDIDKALREMMYILNTDTLEKYLEASLPEKQAFFKRFWAARDPDPSTAVNELKNEYFKRVNFANRNFTAFGTEGWLTDRGRILIKFGYPDDIERHPFDMNSKPYEIWRYYNLRKVFLFVDRTGFGDYRLHPDYIDMEYR